MNLKIYLLPLLLSSCSNVQLDFCNNENIQYEYKSTDGNISRYRFDIKQQKFVVFGHHKMIDEPEWSEVSLETKIDDQYFIVGSISISKNIFEESAWYEDGVNCKKIRGNEIEAYVECYSNKYAGSIRYLYNRRKGVILIQEYYRNGAQIESKLIGKFGLGYSC